MMMLGNNGIKPLLLSVASLAFIIILGLVGAMWKGADGNIRANQTAINTLQQEYGAIETDIVWMKSKLDRMEDKLDALLARP